MNMHHNREMADELVRAISSDNTVSHKLLQTEFMALSHKEQYNFIQEITQHIRQTQQKNINLGSVLFFLSRLVLELQTEYRFTSLVQIISLIEDVTMSTSKDVYNILDTTVIQSLQPLEIISMANYLTEQMQKTNNKNTEASMWGLIKVIPSLHAINQKEFAQDIYMLAEDVAMQGIALECLTSLVFGLDHENRVDLVLFFAEALKNYNDEGARYLIIDFMKKVTSALPENDRVLIADNIAPLIYYTDTHLVKKSLEYFAVAISLMPAVERFHYTQMVASLINDQSVRNEVIDAIEKAIPFLPNEYEKVKFTELLSQFECEKFTLNNDPSLVTAYYSSHEYEH